MKYLARLREELRALEFEYKRLAGSELNSPSGKELKKKIIATRQELKAPNLIKVIGYFREDESLIAVQFKTAGDVHCTCDMRTYYDSKFVSYVCSDLTKTGRLLESLQLNVEAGGYSAATMEVPHSIHITHYTILAVRKEDIDWQFVEPEFIKNLPENYFDK